MTFEEFLELFQLRHFVADEFLIGTSRPGNTMPPEDLWPNIVPTAIVLDHLRAHLGRPIIITSCYRNDEYNRRIRGARRSPHPAFRAIDFGVAGIDPSVAFDTLLSWRGRWFPCASRVAGVEVVLAAGRTPFEPLAWKSTEDGHEFQFRGGLGRYRTFTHVDTRGIDATWGHRRQAA